MIPSIRNVPGNARHLLYISGTCPLCLSTKAKRFVFKAVLRMHDGEIMANPPVLQGVDAPTEAVITLTADKFTFELEGEPANSADLKLIIQASAPQSNGISRAYGKASQVGEPLEAVSEEYNIKTAYDEKYGAPNAATPKVFMKYFFVNTKTGEKSGEMLASVALKADAGE